jgi:hypothetical protein
MRIFRGFWAGIWIAAVGSLLIEAMAAERAPHVNLTHEALKLKLKRENTGLGFAPEVTIESILEYVRSKRGGKDPLFIDEEKSNQLVLLDADGKRWTAETDGGVTEIQDEHGRYPFVFETKTEWFKGDELDRMLLSHEALLASGARPDYRYGGGHFHIRIKGHFEKHPLQFASLVNLALKYEPILVHLMMHQRRVDNAKPLTLTRMNSDQLQAAGLPRDSRATLAQYLGTGLNAILDGTAGDCRMDPSLKPYYDAEQKPELSLQENCVLAWLSHFGFAVVGDRTYAINLQSWRGAVSPLKRHKSLELRLFNAPRNAREAVLEEMLVRAMADQAIRSGSSPIRYEERVDAAYDLDSYFLSYNPGRRAGDLAELLLTSGFDQAGVQTYLDEYLDDTKWSARRTRY